MPLCQIGQEFGPESNVAIFARELAGSIYIGQRNKKKILFKKKKKLEQILYEKCPYACLFKNLDQNAMSPFLHENMQVEYI